MTESSQSNPWRDKYRRALTDQENLEKTLTAYQGIIKRSVHELTRAAEGKDTLLDERLQAIRTSAKQNDVTGFDRMLKSLGRVIEEAEDRQEKTATEVNQLLATIASQLVPLAGEYDLKPRVKQFKKELPKALLLPAALKRQLQALSELQQEAISASPKESKGFFSQLFKEKDKTDSVQSTDKNENIDAVEEQSVLEGELVPSNAAHAEPIEKLSGTITHRERAIPRALLTAQDLDTTEVPTRVTIILIELLDYFKTVPAVEIQAEEVRQKMTQGIQWFELAPTLENIRDVVLLSYLSADEEYRNYLNALNEELATLLEAVGLSVEKEKQNRATTETFTSSMQQGVNNIASAIQQHQETDELKKVLEGHVHQLQDALLKQEQHVNNENEDSNEATLSQQLDNLVKKVQLMEANEKTISESLEEEKKRAMTDTLTGLPNREAYNQKIYGEMQRWQRYQHPLSLAIVDIDFFKKINDNYGHQTGDKVLRVVSHFISKKLREIDFIARFGGEEFVLILPETTTEQALVLLNRTREKLANTPFKTQDQKINVTVSIGVAEFKENDTTETVFARADEALYKAKESGRNKCCEG